MDSHRANWYLATAQLGCSWHEGFAMKDYEHARLKAYFAGKAEQLSQPDGQGMLPLHRVSMQNGANAVALVKTFLEAHPNAARIQDSTGSLPLHYATRYQKQYYGIDIISALLAAHPKGVEQQDNAGFLPLHYVVYFRSLVRDCAVTVVRTLLAAFPEGARKKSNAKKLPLHLAVSCSYQHPTPMEVVMELLQAFPSGAGQEDADGRLPLHIAVENQSAEHGLEIVKALLAAFPGGARAKDNKNGIGRLPLHIVAQRKNGKHDMAIMTELLATFPLGIQQEDLDGSLPLHIAMTHQKTEERGVSMITALLNAHPRGLQHKDHRGDFPLHIALQRHKGKYALSLLTAILAADPQAARRKDKAGRLPLHIATQHQGGTYGLALVKALLTAFPDAVHHKDNENELPLHCAVKYQKGVYGVAVVKALLDAYPDGVQQTRDHERLPLHIAAQYQTTAGEDSLTMIMALLAAFPEAAQHKDDVGDLPLHDAARSQKGKYGLEVVTALLAVYEHGAQRGDNEGCLPLHVAAEHQKGEFGLAVIETLLAAHAAAVQHKDDNDELPLHCAAKYQTGKYGMSVVKAIYRANPLAAQQKTKAGQLPLNYAKDFNPSECEVAALLERVTEENKLTAAYAALTAEHAEAERAPRVRAAKLISSETRRVSRGASHDLTESNGSNTFTATAALAAAVSTVVTDNGMTSPAGTFLQAGHLFREMFAAVDMTSQEIHRATQALSHLLDVCVAGEDAVAQLRTCHDALAAYVAAMPLPGAMDATLVEARNVARAAVRKTSGVLSDALHEADRDAMSVGSALIALLQRVRDVTGVGVQLDVSPREPSSKGGVSARAAVEAAAVAATTMAAAANLPDSLKSALTRLEKHTAGMATAMSRFAALPPATLAQLGGKARPSRLARESMREVTGALCLPSDDISCAYYLTFEAPWKAVCSSCAALAAHAHIFHNKLDTAVTKIADIAEQLAGESAAWTAAFEEQDGKMVQLESAYSALRKARSILLHAQVDAADAESGEESDAEHECDRVRLARQRCRLASAARDKIAMEMLATALAYYPELLVSQRKWLRPGDLPTMVRQRWRDDYKDVQPLKHARAGRHTLLDAKFDGVACMLKVVPAADGSSLAWEAGILKQVKHPNIVELLAVFVERDCAYLHMTYASQGDLEHFLATEAATASTARNPATTNASAVTVLPPSQLQRMVRQLCEAVAYLAERSIVHCDIKPSNVFVDGQRDDESLHVVLGNFDVSHTVSDHTATLMRPVVDVATCYTPGFAPPEVLHAPAGHPPCVSSAIDVYGLGCVIFAMHMYPRTLPKPLGADDDVAQRSDLFSPNVLLYAANPAVSAWATAVPREAVQAATRAQPRTRASARELLHSHFALASKGSSANASIQRPTHWLHQSHMGSWLEEEPEAVRVAVERLLNATAEHGTTRFKVKRVRRLEHPALWASYTAQRLQLAGALLAEEYTAPSGIRPFATEKHGFVYPLQGAHLEAAAGEVFLFHGPTKFASIATSGFDVRYSFAGGGAGAVFGRGMYFAESASKADHYVGRDGARPLTMVLARVLLGRTAKTDTSRGNAPFLPEVHGRSTAALPVYYDSLLADMRTHGRPFREIVVGEGSRAYPELFVEYERV